MDIVLALITGKGFAYLKIWKHDISWVRMFPAARLSLNLPAELLENQLYLDINTFWPM